MSDKDVTIKADILQELLESARELYSSQIYRDKYPKWKDSRARQDQAIRTAQMVLDKA